MQENDKFKRYLLRNNWKIESPEFSFEDLEKINPEIIFNILPSFLFNIGENLVSENPFNFLKKENIELYKSWLENFFPSRFDKEKEKFNNIDTKFFIFFTGKSPNQPTDIEDQILKFIYFNYLEKILTKPDLIYLNCKEEIYSYNLDKKEELNWKNIKDVSFKIEEGSVFTFFYYNLFDDLFALTFSLSSPRSDSYYILESKNIDFIIQKFIKGIYIKIDESNVTEKGSVSIKEDSIYNLKPEFKLDSYPKNIREFTEELKTLFINTKIKNNINNNINSSGSHDSKDSKDSSNKKIITKTSFNLDSSNSYEFTLPKTFNLLLEGRPGVGKTRWIQSFCKEVLEPLNYLFIQTDLISLTKIKLPNFTKKRICFVIDDVDNLALDRNKYINKETDRILKILDGSSFNDEFYESVLILMTANSTENWDKAALRKGRIHKLYYFETDF